MRILASNLACIEGVLVSGAIPVNEGRGSGVSVIGSDTNIFKLGKLSMLIRSDLWMLRSTVFFRLLSPGMQIISIGGEQAVFGTGKLLQIFRSRNS